MFRKGPSKYLSEDYLYNNPEKLTRRRNVVKAVSNVAIVSSVLSVGTLVADALDIFSLQHPENLVPWVISSLGCAAVGKSLQGDLTDSLQRLQARRTQQQLPQSEPQPPQN